MSAELFVVRESFPLVLISLSLSTRNSKNITARFFLRINIYTHREQEQQQHITLSHARDKKERESVKERVQSSKVCVPVRNNRTGNRESDPRVRCRTVFVVVDSFDGRKEKNTVVVVVVAPSSLFSLIANKGGLNVFFQKSR